MRAPVPDAPGLERPVARRLWSAAWCGGAHRVAAHSGVARGCGGGPARARAPCRLAAARRSPALDARIAAIDHELATIAREHPVARRLQQVPGVGVLTSTALVASVGHIHAFRGGRQFASWLGLTPRESSTGGRRYLGGISKRGDVYLRCLLTHGARAVLLTAQRTVARTPQRVTAFQRWAASVAVRRGHNKAAIAVANKLARMIWAVWHHDVDFRVESRVAA